MRDWLVLQGSSKKLNKNSTHRFGVTRFTSSGSSNIVESGIIISNKCNLRFLSNCFNDEIIKSFSSSLWIVLRVCLQDDDPTQALTCSKVSPVFLCVLIGALQVLHIQLSQFTTMFDPKNFFMSGSNQCTGQVCLLTFDLKRFLQIAHKTTTFFLLGTDLNATTQEIKRSSDRDMIIS